MTTSARVLMMPFLLTLATAQQPTAATTPAAIDWQTDLTIARTMAKQLHRPLFVVFRCER